MNENQFPLTPKQILDIAHKGVVEQGDFSKDFTHGPENCRYVGSDGNYCSIGHVLKHLGVSDDEISTHEGKPAWVVLADMGWELSLDQDWAVNKAQRAHDKCYTINEFNRAMKRIAASLDERLGE